jgi:hypothetical protein
MVGFAHLVHPRQAEAGVAADMDGDVGPLFPQGAHHAQQVVIGAQRRMHRARAQPREKDVLGGRLADDQREVLILAVVAVEERELLVPVGGIVGGVEVQRDLRGKRPAVLLP